MPQARGCRTVLSLFRGRRQAQGSVCTQKTGAWARAAKRRLAGREALARATPSDVRGWQGTGCPASRRSSWGARSTLPHSRDGLEWEGRIRLRAAERQSATGQAQFQFGRNAAVAGTFIRPGGAQHERTTSIFERRRDDAQAAVAGRSASDQARLVAENRLQDRRAPEGELGRSRSGAGTISSRGEA